MIPPSWPFLLFVIYIGWIYFCCLSFWHVSTFRTLCVLFARCVAFSFPYFSGCTPLLVFSNYCSCWNLLNNNICHFIVNHCSWFLKFILKPISIEILVDRVRDSDIDFKFIFSCDVSQWGCLLFCSPEMFAEHSLVTVVGYIFPRIKPRKFTNNNLQMLEPPPSSSPPNY